MEHKQQLGEVVVTAGVAERARRDQSFLILIATSLQRHENGDWGRVYKDDKEANDASFEGRIQARIVSAYTIDPIKGESKGFGDNTLWIITEWDRSVTTILFPDEY